MATSGTIKGGTYGGGHLWLTFDWSQSSQNITNNTTTMNWTLKLNWNASLNFSASKSYSVSVNGTSYSGSYTSGASGSSGTKTLASGSTTIFHNGDGTKSFSVSATFKIAITWSGTSLSSMSLSGSGTLNTIPRASSISSLTSSVVINGSDGLTVNINRKSTSFTHTVTFCLGSYSQVFNSVATSQWIAIPITWLNALASTNSLTGTCRIQTYNGASAIGSSVSANFTAYRPSASTISLSTTSLSCTGANTLGVNISRINSNFAHTVTYAFGNYSYSLSEIGTSTTYVIPQSWLNAIVNSTSGTGAVTVTTYYGSINLGSHVANYTLTVPDNVRPTLLSVSECVINPSTITSWDIYLKNISNCQLDISASGTFGSTIKTIYVNGVSVSTPYVDKLLNVVGNKDYSVYVTDTRGRTSNTIIKTISIVDYEIPTLKINKIFRCIKQETETGETIAIADDEGTSVVVNASYTMSSCNGKNSMTRLIQHKDTIESYYKDDGSFDTDIDFIVSEFQINKSYDFLITVMDMVGKVATYNGDGIIPTSFAIIDILKGGKGIAFGKMASEEQVIDCEWSIKTPQIYDENGKSFLNKFYRIGDVIISTNTENPSKIYGGTWQLLCPGRTLVCVDTGQSEFNVVKKTGGSKLLQSHSHSASSGYVSNDHSHYLSLGTSWADLQGKIFDIASQDSGTPIGTNGIFTGSQSGGYYGYGNAVKGSRTDTVGLNASHSHTVSGNTGGISSNHTHGISIESTGNGNSQNLQPFMVVYMWVRTA